MSTDPTAITTEIPVTEAMPPVTAIPAAAPAPTGAAPVPSGGAGGQSQVQGTEPCPHCGTPLALDQRYCLECGAPRTYLSGMLLDRMRSSAAAQPAPGQPLQPPTPGAAGVLAAAPPSSESSTWQRGSVLTLIAGIGVLLLAMGVGVLIGRSGGSSGSSAPQIVTVPAAAAGAASTTTTPTTPEAGAAAKAGAAAGAAGGGAKHKAKEAGVGAVPSKPAPPAVLKNLRTGSGQSYEQKSKNLPNVVSTG